MELAEMMVKMVVPTSGNLLSRRGVLLMTVCDRLLDNAADALAGGDSSVTGEALLINRDTPGTRPTE